MRKILLSISIILLVYQNILAQKIYVAPVVGANATFANLSKVMKDYYKSITLSDEDAEVTVTSKFPPAMGFQLGGLVSYSTGAISLESGLLITKKGFSIKRDGKGKDPSGNAFSISGKSTTSIFYLEIPLWASYEIGESGIKISAGPSFGLAIGGKTKVKLNENGSSTTESSKLSIGSTPYSDNVKATDFSVNLGIGKEIELGGKTLDLTLFAQPSISTWNPTAKISKDFGARHFTTGVRAAYYFQIK